MRNEWPALTPVQESLYLTLCGRALDSRSPRPILGDDRSAEIVREIGYDCARQPHAARGMRDIALRTKKLDDIVRTFVDAHPDAVVLDLGAGLDTRVFRIDPPPTVRWYDIDFPAVAAMRRRLLPERANTHVLGRDLTDPNLLEDFPRGQRAIAVADGLLAFVAHADVVSLLNRITSHFREGEIAFNGYTRFHVWALKRYSGTSFIADVVTNPGFDDPREPEQWAPGLTFTEETLLTRAPEVRRYPWPARLVNRLVALNAPLSRRFTTVLRYRF